MAATVFRGDMSSAHLWGPSGRPPHVAHVAHCGGGNRIAALRLPVLVIPFISTSVTRRKQRDLAPEDLAPRRKAEARFKLVSSPFGVVW